MSSPRGLERCVRYEESPDRELREGQPVGVFCKINTLLGESIYITLPTIARNEALWVSGEELFVLGQKFPEDQKLDGVLGAVIVRPFSGDETVAIEDSKGNTYVVKKDNLFIPEVGE